jgi:ferrous-iron efflux pump FieF
MTPDAQLMRRATVASVAVAIALTVIKLAAFLLTGSVALLASLVDSGVDALASVLNLLAVRHALTPADREHRFGHGKAEPLAGLGQAAFIAGSGLFLAFEACARLLHPRLPEHAMTGIAVMVASIVATTALVLYQRYVIRATGSLAIRADALHYAGDVLVNLGVIAALLIGSIFGVPSADPLIALVIAGFILKSAREIIGQSLAQLMDRELPDATRARIREIAMAHPLVRDVHELRTRESGRTTFIQLHLEMDGALSLYRAHAVADAVTDALLAEFPNAEIIVHEDPAGVEAVANASE